MTTISTRAKRAVTAGVTFAILAGNLSAAFMRPSKAFAVESLPDMGGNLRVEHDDKYKSGHGMTIWTAQDGKTPLFCADSLNHDHATSGEGGSVIPLGQLKTSTGESYDAYKQHMIDYLVYWGTIGVKSGATYYGVSGADLQAATQFALWGVRQGSMQDDSGVNMPFYNTGWTREASDAAIKFFNDAANYANNPDSDKRVPQGVAYAFVPDGGKQVMTYFGMKLGSLKITKISGNTLYTAGNNCYSLAGAEYTVYSDEGLTTSVGTITTDENGEGTLENLQRGNYYIKETKAPKGYAIASEVEKVSIEVEQTTNANVQDGAQYTTDPLHVRKVDKDTGEQKAAGGASLAGAEFKISYYKGYYENVSDLPEKPERTWTVKTDENGDINLDDVQVAKEKYLVAGDEFYTNAENKVVYPLGTITVQETKAPTGYMLPDGEGEDSIALMQIKSEDVNHHQEVDADLNYTQKEQVVRGNVKFTKVLGVNKRPLANVPFKITSKTTGETHYAVTDANGVIDTSTMTKNDKTNANDKAFNGDSVDESKLSSENGIFFTGKAATNTGDATTQPNAATPAANAQAQPATTNTDPATQPTGANGATNTETPNADAEKTSGMLPYDTYEVEEIRTSVNANVDEMAKFEFTVSENGTTIDAGEVVNTVTPTHIPQTGQDSINPEILIAGGVIIAAGVGGVALAIHAKQKKNDNE